MKNQRVTLFNICHPSSYHAPQDTAKPPPGHYSIPPQRNFSKTPLCVCEGGQKWPTVRNICGCRSSKQESDSPRQGETTPGFSHCGQSQKPLGSPYLIHQKLASTSNALPAEAAWPPRVPGTRFGKHIWFGRRACVLQG